MKISNKINSFETALTELVINKMVIKKPFQQRIDAEELIACLEDIKNTHIIKNDEEEEDKEDEDKV